MARNVKVVTAAFLLCLASAVGAHAQDSVLADLYGRGVHAYYSYQYDQAADYLVAAIDQGSQDPRVHYYLGLVFHATGRSQEAEAEFKRGAQLEATSTDRLFDVGRALQRVQGPIRLEIENHRSAARIAARRLQQQRARARYGDLERAEQEGALRRRPGAAPAAPPGGEPPAELPPADVEEMPLEEPPAEQPPAEAAPVEDDPFAVEPAPPSARPPAEPAAPAQPSQPAPSDDPFGAPAETPAADDPFGGAAEPAGEQPAGDDPFGAPAQPPAETPAADDPFGAPAQPPAEEPAEGDPFGNLEPARPAAGQPAAAERAAPAAGGGESKGALGGLFRSLRRAVVPEGAAGAAPAARGNDPFAQPGGNAPAAAAPAGNDPFGDADAAPAAGGDPFGDSPATPAAENNDPFGEAPAEEAGAGANDDPFGNP